jgi:hypothetical protein
VQSLAQDVHRGAPADLIVCRAYAAPADFVDSLGFLAGTQTLGGGDEGARCLPTKSLSVPPQWRLIDVVELEGAQPGCAAASVLLKRT